MLIHLHKLLCISSKISQSKRTLNILASRFYQKTNKIGIPCIICQYKKLISRYFYSKLHTKESSTYHINVLSSSITKEGKARIYWVWVFIPYSVFIAASAKASTASASAAWLLRCFFSFCYVGFHFSNCSSSICGCILCTHVSLLILNLLVIDLELAKIRSMYLPSSVWICWSRCNPIPAFHMKYKTTHE